VCRSPAEKPCGEKSLRGFSFIESAFEGVKLRQRVKKVVQVAWNVFVLLKIGFYGKLLLGIF
jgi:hypothetical protein